MFRDQEPGIPGPVPGPPGIPDKPGPIRPPSTFLPGPSGDVGFPGQKGQKGRRGSTGSPGATGATGSKGNIGSRGDIGFTGAKGLTGPSGTIRDCSPCSKNIGMKGANGAPGDYGIPGATGTIGPKGFPGRSGLCLKGDVGHPGLTGEDGDAGRKGYNGARGQIGETGDSKPISSLSLIYKLQQTIGIVRRRLSECCSPSRLGRDLDRMIRQTLPAFCKVPFQLPDGKTGPQRRQTSRCRYVRGPPGSPGFPGSKGDAGDHGFTGPTGPTGSQGSTGNRGSIGQQGPTGLKGNQGRSYFQTCLPRGEPGSTGEKGQIGDPGLIGFQGRRGPRGDDCPRSVGLPGDTGDAGTPGVNGAKGQKGTQGEKGQKGEIALGDITEESYERYLNMIQEIIKKIETGGCCSSATCTHNGVQYQHGEQIKPNCTTKCTCQNGEWSCSKTECFSGATCSASGDPHYTTFDGTRHHFQGICEYVLAKDCTRNRFTIKTVNTPCGRTAACVTEATIVVHNLFLNIGLKRGSGGGQLFVNGRHYPNNGNGFVLSIGEVEIIRSSTSIVILLTTTGVVVTWTGTSYISVKVSEDLKHQVCGLCGTYNDNSTDDFQTRGGVVVSNTNEFGFSWLLDRYTVSNCTCPPPDLCSATIQQQGAARCNILKGMYFSACNNVVDPAPYIDDCIFDYCRCPSSQHEECYCDNLENYAKQCAEKGIVLNKWKSLYCPVTCPNGMIYQECGTACPETCVNYADPPVCIEHCVEGCFCPPGQVLLRNSICVDVEACPRFSCNRMPNLQILGPGLSVGGPPSDVIIDVGKCRENHCQGSCLPTKTRKETVRLSSGSKEVEIIESCQCLSNEGSSCAVAKKEVTYFANTSSEITIGANQCVGSCGVHRINCIPTKEKTVAVDNGENGIVVATVIEKCQCYLECYRKSYYEKYREVASREEVEIDVGVCEAHEGFCRPLKTHQYNGPSLEKDGKPYSLLIIDSCGTIFPQYVFKRRHPDRESEEDDE
ncbi:otogelin-like protein isoform X2 [Dysidea avara]|uniref:otogelin-like protein isoform X2 n=1 Tax=Dysidea avara TaxID=196820 RepID=UPI00332B2C36